MNRNELTNGFSALNRLHQDLDRMFGSLYRDVPFGQVFRSGGRVEFPPLNGWEEPDTLYVESEVPGFKLEDLEIFVKEKVLTISGERKPLEGNGLRFHRQERPVGKFTRVFQLPSPVDADKVEARLQDGVLTLTLPKAQAAKPRRIEVKSG